ncbi:MAG TPA: hypothetical protein VJ821_17160 [Anaerolineales bacterium]|nr:hypothetical protein [Anaerolineales bacterium]
MKSNFRIILAIASLAMAALACQAVTGGGGGGGGGTPTETSNVLLSDNFSSQQWGIGTDADSSVEYAGEALQMIVYTTNYFVWSTPNDQDYQNVHMEVTVMNNGTDSTTAFGVMCNQQAGADSSFYYFAMTPSGQYAIAKAQTGQTDIFLTNNDEWATSDAIARNAASYRVGADCGNGTLTLYVDGQQIATVSDSSYSSGGVAVFTWSGEEATNTNVSFDDFLMTQLP